jgi:hypothetical protein
VFYFPIFTYFINSCTCIYNHQCCRSLKLITLFHYCTEAKLLVVPPGSLEHQFAQCRIQYRAHVAVAFERAVGRTVHYNILTATETSVTIVKSGVDMGLENGRNLFVVNLCESTNVWTCIDGCGKKKSKGRPCVHILKALQSKGLPFFDERYFHSHWLVTPVVTSKDIRTWCKQHDTSSDPLTSDDDDSNDPGNDNDDPMDPNTASNRSQDSGNVNQSLVTRSGSDTSQVKGMSNRFAFAKNIFDNVAKVNKSSITSINVIYLLYTYGVMLCHNCLVPSFSIDKVYFFMLLTR